MKFFIILTVCLFEAVFAQQIVFGGWNPIATNDSTVTQLATRAVEHHNTVNNNAYYKKLVKIQEAQYQVVSGFAYEVKFSVGVTNCAKTEAYNDSCQVTANSPLELCTYNFWFKPGPGDAEITSSNCVTI